ncbi:hypothetical protein N5D37_17280 [Comamonas aquatica]|uniref:hypothetical protein n=1 Tax=Comamonas aquatica TaxID=225991 RepID=UPI00244C357B|nr:hypothetical protein [Comamonas aquatica]MDH1767359.1 hypothetical protein [Comamonas aquatica]
MFKITGLDKLQKNLKDAQRALSELDGELGVVNFDPNDPASIEGAIQSVNRMIDDRLGMVFKTLPLALSEVRRRA